MAYDLTLTDPAADGDKRYDFALCSTGAWDRFVKWATSLPTAGPALLTLCENGKVTGTDRLSADLLDLKELHPPSDEGVALTLAVLAEHVGVGTETETAAVTSGAE